MSSEREYTVDERVRIRDTHHWAVITRILHGAGGRRYELRLDDGTVLSFVSGDQLQSEWPYDADRTHPLAARRIPVVATTHPQWRYEVALVIGDELWGSAEPRPEEVELLASYIDYRQQWYNPGWQARHREWPLDTDSGTNTVVLFKYDHGGWGYRRASWTQGPPLVPTRNSEPISLRRLLDRINSVGDELYDDWARWIAERPEIFGQNQEA